MVISHSLNYTFVSTMKCATNSLYSILVERYQGRRVGDFHCRDLRLAPPGSFVFTVCRNPYLRAVSIWWSTCMRGHDRYGFRQACGNGDDFETFMLWVATQQRPVPLLQNQSEWQQGIRFDRVLHLENLATEFAVLPFVADAVVEFPEINTTLYNRQPAQQLLTPVSIDAIRRWAAPDFENFGYSYDIPALAGDNKPQAGQC